MPKIHEACPTCKCGIQEYLTISTVPGVSFKQTIKAPVDYIEIHPFLLGEILANIKGETYIDIHKTTETPKYQGKISAADLENARKFCRKEE